MPIIARISFSLFILVSIVISAPASAKDKFIVVTTFTVLADMAANVGGDAAEIRSVTKPGAEIHNYQPTPRDILHAHDADLILWNGMGLELWFERFLTNLKNVPSATLSEGVEPMGIAKGPYTGKPNPHAWMSPKSALIYITNIRNAFIKHDPNNADIYKRNAKKYSQQIKNAITPLRDALQIIPREKRWLVSSEGAFSYLARDFEMHELYLWPINADQQGTPKQVKNVIDTVRKNNIKAIFSESTVSDAPARQVARETGAKYSGILYVDSLSAADGPVPTYLDLLKITTQTIVTGLTR